MSALPKVVSWSTGINSVTRLSRWYGSQQLLEEKTVHDVGRETIDFLSDFKEVNYWPGFSPSLLIFLLQKQEICKSFF